MLAWALLLIAAGFPETHNATQLQNSGFEAPLANGTQIPGWDVSIGKGASGISIQADRAQVKEGVQALRIESTHPGQVRIGQELFLPVGTTWRVSVWVRGETSEANGETTESAGLEIGTPAGSQGRALAPSGIFPWHQEQVDFRVPSPGRVRVVLFDNSSGKLWFDDVRLEPLTVTQDADIRIVNSRIGKRPIDLKQGGQFIEPLCYMIRSMLAQQVDGDSFEEETPCKPSYKRGVDWPYRPWYPDGAVHEATYSLDEKNPYNGKRSQKIELPMARARAGISQDGFYLKQGTAYRLRLHMRGVGRTRVWASLRGAGGLIAGPALLGWTESDWRGEEVLLRANRTISNATLTIEFEGPGTLWLDRISLIGEDSILGLWKPDVVQALKSMNPGLIRFGGSMIEVYEWDKSIGPWDERVPYVTGPWGGLESNFVGIEEFAQLAHYVGAEPLICVRWSGKTPQDAANEVEYMNGGAETAGGKLRARNGHPDPYRVKYWQIGNEVGGSQYDDSVRAFAEAMRRVDRTIKILSSFPSLDTLKEGGGYLDYLCPHHYQIADLPGEQASFELLKNEAAAYKGTKDVRVAVTEWNTTAGQMGLTRGMLLTMGNALSVARYQNLMHRYADLVEIAVRSNLSDSFGSGMLQPGPGWLYLSPAYYTQKLYQRAAGTYPIEIDDFTKTSWELREPDLSATVSSDGKVLRIFAVNSTAEPEKRRFRLEGFSSSVAGGEVAVLKDRENALDSEAMNSQNDPERITVASHTTDLNGSHFQFEFAPFTVTLLELRLDGEQKKQ
ncbi:MAG: alpha-L-arabinofuranosidase C-terminal domain-containing protein [Terracidiphilus sp.]|jgi:alpha-N-arabinofuranosidase